MLLFVTLISAERMVIKLKEATGDCCTSCENNMHRLHNVVLLDPHSQGKTKSVTHPVLFGALGILGLSTALSCL